MNLDDLTKQLAAVNAELDAANAVIKEVSGRKAQLERDLQDAMTQVGIADFKANGLHFKLEIEETPKATNWDEVYAYIQDNERPWILHKRLSLTALRELKDGGEVIPGIEWSEHSKLSVTKARG